MPLRNWCTNSNLLLSKFPASPIDSTYVLLLNDDDITNTLGLTWQPSSDSYRFIIGTWAPPIRMIKCSLLSDINKMYDPIGLIKPVLIKGNIFLQQVWSLKLSWDCLLSHDLQNRWKNFYIRLNVLEGLSIPQRIFYSPDSSIGIHEFSDASQEVYGACVYLWSSYPNGSCITSM